MGVACVVIDKWNISESNKCKQYPTFGTDSFFSTQTHLKNIMLLLNVSQHNTTQIYLMFHQKYRTNFPTPNQ